MRPLACASSFCPISPALESLLICTTSITATLLGYGVDSQANSFCRARGHRAAPEQRVLGAHAEESIWSC